MTQTMTSSPCPPQMGVVVPSFTACSPDDLVEARRLCGNIRRLGDLCERMYAQLSKQLAANGRAESPSPPPADDKVVVLSSSGDESEVSSDETGGVAPPKIDWNSRTNALSSFRPTTADRSPVVVRSVRRPGKPGRPFRSGRSGKSVSSFHRRAPTHRTARGPAGAGQAWCRRAGAPRSDSSAEESGEPKFSIVGGHLLFRGHDRAPGSRLVFIADDLPARATPLQWKPHHRWCLRHLSPGDRVRATARRFASGRVENLMFVGRLEDLKGDSGNVTCNIGDIARLGFTVQPGKALRSRPGKWVWFRIESDQNGEEVWAGRVGDVAKSVARKMELAD